ncbi:hypothetical protein THIOM_003993 [Candidatus Thiomargarita nelsonii]|uniref:Uncharacterized protein n=1 Tax=Candidatus Thiomargarita nelsonii TaxID=1003181 RepID=A0A176RWZ2_9GAMM|nr:hypothetical protein THIOM_003993 [Candidatus Thiomargarita nelsonii]
MSTSTAAKTPPLIHELPPKKSRFSIRITEHPACAASIAAANPAKPLPITITSACSCQYDGGVVRDANKTCVCISLNQPLF